MSRFWITGLAQKESGEIFQIVSTEPLETLDEALNVCRAYKKLYHCLSLMVTEWTHDNNIIRYNKYFVDAIGQYHNEWEV